MPSPALAPFPGPVPCPVPLPCPASYPAPSLSLTPDPSLASSLLAPLAPPQLQRHPLQKKNKQKNGFFLLYIQGGMGDLKKFKYQLAFIWYQERPHIGYFLNCIPPLHLQFKVIVPIMLPNTLYLLLSFPISKSSDLEGICTCKYLPCLLTHLFVNFFLHLSPTRLDRSHFGPSPLITF